MYCSLQSILQRISGWTTSPTDGPGMFISLLLAVYSLTERDADSMCLDLNAHFCKEP